MTAAEIRNPLMAEITCGSLLQQLQQIWDEVGETEEDRDKMLLQLEKECLDVYKRNVDHAAKSKSCLIQALAQSRSELSNLLSVLGQKDITGVPDKTSGKIKEQLAAIAPVLDQLWKLKEERIKEFSSVQSQIQKIQAEIDGSELEKGPVIDEKDLSLTKLDEFHIQLEDLEKEKSDRLHEVHEYLSTVRDFCSVLGIDFLSTVTNVHPRLCDPIAKSISNDTLARLVKTVATLEEDKKQRLKKIQKLSAELIDLWNLLDTSVDERCLFDNVTHHISASVDEISDAGSLALDLIEQVTAEVERLDQMKASRMKEIALKKQAEIEEILGRAHIEIDDAVLAHENIMSLIDSGKVEPSVLLADMDNQIRKAKEEAVSRKEILDKVEKWMSACEEESWLEDYNRDDNRYNGSRGAHLNLKRAEKARILVNKIPAMVDILVAKTRAWEEDQDITFTYDGVPLLAMLDEYAMLRHDRAEERRRMRDHKKYHEQLNTEQETIFGSRPSPVRAINTKRVSGGRVNGGGGTPGRRLSLNIAQNGSSRSAGREGRRGESCGGGGAGTRPVAPVNYVAISKEDAASHISCNESFHASP